MQQHVLVFILLLSLSATFGQALPDRPSSVTYFTVKADQSEVISSRNMLTYDLKGRLIKSRTEAPVSDNLFTSHLVATYTYDSRDSLTGFIFVGANKPNGNAFRTRFVFTRDERGNKVAEEGSSWDFNRKTWRKTQRTLQTFDGQNRVTGSRFSNYNETTQAWGSESVNTYSYTDQQQVVESAGQRSITVYDERNRVVRVTSEAVEKGQWTLKHLTTTDYSATETINRQYSQPKISQPYSIVTTRQNAQGKPDRVNFQLDQSVHRITDLPLDSLTNRSFNSYVYDPCGRLTEQVNWEYLIGTSTTRRTSGVRYTYDNQYPEQPTLKVYPNPTTGLVNLLNEGSYGCVERYEVLTLSGQIVQQVAALVDTKLADTPQCSPKINLSPLPDGHYMVRLFLGDNTVISHRVTLKKNR